MKVFRKKYIGLAVGIMAILVISLLLFYKASIKIDKKNVEIPDDNIVSEVETSTSTDSLPEIFPKDFPIYSTADLESSAVSEGENIIGMSATWKVSEEFSKVLDYYKSELDNNLWAQDVFFDEDDSYGLSVIKGEFSGFLGITKESKNSTIVSVGLRKTK